MASPEMGSGTSSSGTSSYRAEAGAPQHVRRQWRSSCRAQAVPPLRGAVLRRRG
ncbi:hypothetical protein Q5425_26745 [Amycolatopsis sp. A133]|nr:hypothetical protein [Amycolatopsis sp. A133]MDQ7807351.1 hypothetical protein [Amycolatopsis sp. A133]